ncbi:hypothetical protein GU927_003265 [Rhodobacteraceae bacterium HSP-20]|uniref:Uncharacterized protein n=1 Tax=Paragemmobacter amnigenus TaxID=2852097 RepID=A0ABS6IZA6_9RHOB|nr:hypothetical protein [Rhodobacter amnigenus]MBU9696861.1 hypothetical protein [Rhodobacter amnigenus]MBV4388088.1 hypothetical protein [Rhodobacter amnigenus]
MGISTPKPPFNLAEFLAQPAPPRARRKPTWTRPAPAPETLEDDTPAEE